MAELGNRVLSLKARLNSIPSSVRDPHEPSPFPVQQVAEVCDHVVDRAMTEFSRQWGEECGNFVLKEELKAELRNLVRREDWLHTRQHLQEGITYTVGEIAKMQAAIPPEIFEGQQAMTGEARSPEQASVGFNSMNISDSPQAPTTSPLVPLMESPCYSEAPLQPFLQGSAPRSESGASSRVVQFQEQSSREGSQSRSSPGGVVGQ